MAVKFRHKETGLFWCRAKGRSPSRNEYYELGEESIFRKRHLSKRGAIYETATEKQKREWIGKKHAISIMALIIIIGFIGCLLSGALIKLGR